MRVSKSYNNTAHNILKNEIDLILPQVPRKQKCGIITTLVSSFIGLPYEGIMKVSLVSYIISKIKHYIKWSRLWMAKPLSSTTN